MADSAPETLHLIFERLQKDRDYNTFLCRAMIVRVRREVGNIDIELPRISDDGPHPLISGGKLSIIFLGLTVLSISDSLFSLIIFIYVAVTFLYIFYAFCWREAPRKELTEEEKKVCICAVILTLIGRVLIAEYPDDY